MKLSVVIPVGPQEGSWRELLPDLSQLPNDAEVLFVTSEKREEKPMKNYQWIFSSKFGRGALLNAGARRANNPFLWFLHADSRFTKKTVPVLMHSIKSRPDALHYFNLQFNDGPFYMKINSAGARFRSNCLGVPFGDQGFCLSKEWFDKIGGYPEEANFGEDHLFMWRAKQCGMKLNCTGATLFTSARKYQTKGWFWVTLSNQFLWIKQAIPEWLRWIRKA